MLYYRLFLKTLLLGLLALTGCQPLTFPPPGQQHIWLILWCPESVINIDSIEQPKNMLGFFGLNCPHNNFPLIWKDVTIPNEFNFMTVKYRVLSEKPTVITIPFHELPCFLDPITARCGTFDSDEQPLILIVREKPSSALIEPPWVNISFCPSSGCSLEISPGQSRDVYETATLTNPLLFYAQAAVHLAEVTGGKTSFAARHLQKNIQLHHRYTLRLAEQQETDEYELPIAIRTISVTPEGRVNTLGKALYMLPAQPKLFPDSPGISGRWKGTLQLDNVPPESLQPVPLTLLLRQEGKTLRGNVVVGTSDHLWKESREIEPNHYVFTVSKEGLDSICVHKFDGQALSDNRSLSGTFEVSCYGPWGDRPYYSAGGKWQVTRNPGTNQRPVAQWSSSRIEGHAPLKIELDGSGSYDPDGKLVSYSWHSDNELSFVDHHGKTATFTFRERGVYIVTLTVTDDDGATDWRRMRVIVW